MYSFSNRSVLFLMVSISTIGVTVLPSFAQTPQNPNERSTNAGRTDSTRISSEASDPDPDTFIEIDREPTSLVPMDSLFFYPEEARKNGIEGRVVVRALIGITGLVEKATIDVAADSLLNEAALDVVRRAKFTPAECKGQPLKVWYEIPILYRLKH